MATPLSQSAVLARSSVPGAATPVASHAWPVEGGGGPMFFGPNGGLAGVLSRERQLAIASPPGGNLSVGGRTHGLGGGVGGVGGGVGGGLQLGGQHSSMRSVALPSYCSPRVDNVRPAATDSVAGPMRGFMPGPGYGSGLVGGLSGLVGVDVGGPVSDLLALGGGEGGGARVRVVCQGCAKVCAPPTRAAAAPPLSFFARTLASPHSHTSEAPQPHYSHTTSHTTSRAPRRYAPASRGDGG